MAKLITMRRRPQKFILKRKLEGIRLNHVISHREIDRKNAQLDALEEDIARTRTLVKDYCEQKEIMANKARAHGFDRAKESLVAEILINCAQMIHINHHEAIAAENLARRIAGNITNRPDRFMACDDGEAAPNDEHLSIVIAASAATLLSLRQELALCRQIYGSSLATEPVVDDARAHLSVAIAGNAVSYNFPSSRLARILRKVVTALLVVHNYESGIHTGCDGRTEL